MSPDILRNDPNRPSGTGTLFPEDLKLICTNCADEFLHGMTICMYCNGVCVYASLDSDDTADPGTVAAAVGQGMGVDV